MYVKKLKCYYDLLEHKDRVVATNTGEQYLLPCRVTRKIAEDAIAYDQHMEVGFSYGFIDCFDALVCERYLFEGEEPVVYEIVLTEKEIEFLDSFIP